ncbi:MAG TPA: hypothetical protein VMV24_01730 [Candidatus Dormibacteraeota bacterium]|nr:hypothetical protein [Candidatus Dormibacteraeota bacterium]
MSLDFLENDYLESSDKYNSLSFEAGNAKPSPDNLKEKEDIYEQPENNTNLYNPQKNDNKLSNKIIGVLKKNKVLVLAGGGVGGGVLVLIILIFILAQQLPGFASLLAAQSMARSNRAYERDTAQITSEDLALTAEQPAEQVVTDATFSDATTGGLLSRLRSYTPTGYLNNLKESGVIKINYGPYEKGVGKFLGAEKPISITLNTPEGSNTYAISDIAPSKWAKVSHPLTTLGNKADAISSMNNDLGLINEDGSILLRFGALKQLIASVGGDLSGLISSRFVGKSAQAASEELNVEAESYIDPPGSAIMPLSSELQAAESQADSIATADLNLSTSVGQAAQANILANDGIDTAVSSAVNSTVQDAVTNAKGLLGKFSLPYLVGVPACIIYDGSLHTAQAAPTINKQQNEVIKSYLLVESTASQEKSGSLSAEGIRAINTKLGNVINSNTERAAIGESVNTNSNIMSPQSAVNGQYSIVSSGFSPTLAKWLDPIANTFCPYITNPKVAIGLGIAQIATYVAGILTGGAADGGIAVTEGGIEAAINDGIATSVSDIGTGAITGSVEGTITQSIVKQADTQTFGSILKNEGKKFFEYIQGNGLKKDVGKLTVYGGATYGLTQLANAVVMQNMGTTYDGYSQKTDFTNQAAAGGNALGNSTMQSVYFGTPLSSPDVAYNKNATLSYLAQQNSLKPSYQRYLALSNPYSLLSKLDMNMYADITNFSLGSLFKKVASIFNPTRIISGLFSLFDNKTYADPATSPPDNSDYGIVQWGYTQQEDALMNPATNASASYQPLENAKILNSQTVNYNGSSMSAAQYIKQIYGICFSGDMGKLLTTVPKDGPDTSNTYIVRYKNGNIDPYVGLCSQQYLGPNSHDPVLATKPDLVFRWRLDQSYRSSLNLLAGVQNANK